MSEHLQSSRACLQELRQCLSMKPSRHRWGACWTALPETCAREHSASRSYQRNRHSCAHGRQVVNTSSSETAWSPWRNPEEPSRTRPSGGNYCEQNMSIKSSLEALAVLHCNIQTLCWSRTSRPPCRTQKQLTRISACDMPLSSIILYSLAMFTAIASSAHFVPPSSSCKHRPCA